MSEKTGGIIPQWLLDILACPVPECHGRIDLVDQKKLVCQKCGRRYPIRNGIPVLLIEEAELPPRGE